MFARKSLANYNLYIEPFSPKRFFLGVFLFFPLGSSQTLGNDLASDSATLAAERQFNSAASALTSPRNFRNLGGREDYNRTGFPTDPNNPYYRPGQLGQTFNPSRIGQSYGQPLQDQPLDSLSGSEQGLGGLSSQGQTSPGEVPQGGEGTQQQRNIAKQLRHISAQIALVAARDALHRNRAIARNNRIDRISKREAARAALRTQRTQDAINRMEEKQMLAYARAQHRANNAQHQQGVLSLAAHEGAPSAAPLLNTADQVSKRTQQLLAESKNRKYTPSSEEERQVYHSAQEILRGKAIPEDKQKCLLSGQYYYIHVNSPNQPVAMVCKKGAL